MRVISAILALALIACGSSAARLTVTPVELTVTADASKSSTPTGVIEVTLHDPPSGGAYIAASFTKNGIAGMNFTALGTQGAFNVLFKDPSTVALGTYSDTVQIGLCTDQSCSHVIDGTLVTVAVTYVVTVSATATLTADPGTVGAGLPVTLTWSSTHASACVASGDWSGTLASSGSTQVTPAQLGAHVYSISCSDPGAPAQASATVTALGPALSFTVFPANVPLGKPATLRWQARYAAGCTASGAWSGPLPASGSMTLTPASQGTTAYHLACTNVGGSDQKDVSLTVGAAVSAAATAYRMTESHDGVLIDPSAAQFPSQSAPAWTRNLGAPVSYPLIAGGVVFAATAKPDGSYGNSLYALDASTGAIRWGPVAISGTYFGSGLTYENGRVFVLMFDGGLHAFAASNGASLWTTQLPGYWYEASPNAYGGTVFVAGNAGVSAVDEATGAIRWTATDVTTTDWASPAVASDGVYLQEGYSCRAGAFDPASGGTLWKAQSQCNTPWGYAPVVKNGVFFGRVGGSIDLFDSATGAFKTQIGADRAPAITGAAVIALSSGTLSSTRLSDLAPAWTFTAAGLVTAPVVVNTTVFIGSSSGTVYGLDAATGTQVWTGTSPAAIAADSENGGPQPPSGPAAGEGLLVFVAGTSLVAWQLQ